MTTDQPWPFGRELQQRRERHNLSQRRAAKLAGISEGRWRQLETGVEKTRGVEFPVKTKPRTVIAVARQLDWNPVEALTLAGLPADDELIEHESEHVEPVPEELWRALTSNERASFISLMQSVVEARSPERIPHSVASAEQRGDAARVSYRPDPGDSSDQPRQLPTR